MIRILDATKVSILGCGLALALFLPLDSAHARRFETVLYAFTGGSDGGSPAATLMDKAGVIYGTTQAGGTSGAGTVFSVAPDGTESVLYSFTGGSDGGTPVGGLLKDSAGNLYSTTYFGGAGGAGTVFKLAPGGAETVLYSFTGGNDGGYPPAGLIKDKAGDFYGTTQGGGTGSAGTVFELAPNGTETVLYSFTGGSDGNAPFAGVIRDRAGNLYGTTYGGGSTGNGTVFKLAPDGTETVLYSFTGGSDGGTPVAGLIMDRAGNLYGTTYVGGAGAEGTVFKLAPDGSETVLYSFTGGIDGGQPVAGLDQRAGHLYGTASAGGADGSGVAFRITPFGTETVLHSFAGGSDGATPYAGLIVDGAGNLYGTTIQGGSGANGIVFALSP